LTSTSNFLHGLLDVLANRHHWGVAPSPLCLTCQPQAAQETILHFFTSCSRTSAAWHLLLFRATITLGVALTDKTLLYLAWPPSAARADAAVVLAVITFTPGPGPPDLPLMSWPSTSSKPGSLRPSGAAPSSQYFKEDGWPRGLHFSTSPASSFILPFIFVRSPPPPCSIQQE
jgi:hypothetical protein